MGVKLQLQEPLVIGNRRIYPVVSESIGVYGEGMVASVLPVALIIEDEDILSCALLRSDSIAACLETLVAEYL